MSGLKGLQIVENNVYWDNCLTNGLERRNAQITSMNHMLWQLEIHAKSIVENILRTLNIKFVVTQSLRLRVCFHFQIKLVFQQLFFYHSSCKTFESIWYSGKSFIIFTPKIHIFFFKNPFHCVLIRKIFEEY